MVEKIIDFSVKNVFLVIATTILLAIGSFWAIKNTSLDALPDLSPPQVIVQVEWEGQSPKIIEDQVTFPLIRAFMSLSHIDTARAMTSYENGMIYIIFKDGTDLYWARNRVLEQLSLLSTTLPQGARVSIGPDATGVGWVYQYVLTSKNKSLDELRTLQDFYYKYALLGVDGVSEVASIGGYVKNYEVTLKNDALVNYDLSIEDVTTALKKANNDNGGKVILEGGFEKVVQAKGFVKTSQEIEAISVAVRGDISITISDIADVRIVPQNRRGAADFNGDGEVVGGIVIVRHGENAYATISRIKEKIGTFVDANVTITPVYDRSELIEKAIQTLTHTLMEESVIVLIISALFLLHFRSALVIIITLPLTVGLTFLLMKIFGIDSTIMSLGGIAIAIGAMIDAAIVMVENGHKHISKLTEDGQIIDNDVRKEAILLAAKQVGRPIFFALVIIIVSFLPIFALTGQEGKLFTPLAYTKTFAMGIGAILSITLVPILMIYFLKGHIRDEEHNPINRFFIGVYRPLLKGALYVRVPLLILSFLSMGLIYTIYKKQNWEFMPMLNEQAFMYMPVTPYGIGIDAALDYTKKTDKILKSFPEVDKVFGKVGRADTATDPAPLAMMETIVTFKPQDQWRSGVTYESLQGEMEEALQVKGLTNSWTYPIRGRIDMLLTGIRTPLGIKVYGNDFEHIQAKASEIERILQGYEGTQSVFAERTNTGYFVDIDIDEEKIGQYGVTKEEILMLINNAIGGTAVTTMVDGIERYPISVRYEDVQRDDVEAIKEIRVKTKLGHHPLREFATISYKEGPSVLVSEKGMKVAFIYITQKDGVTAKQYKEEAQKLLSTLKLPEGYSYEWAGESEHLESAFERLKMIVPTTLFLIFVLIYLALKDIKNTLLVFFTLPFAILGGLVYIDMLNYNLSIAVVVGFLALLGIAAETAIVMIIYLQEAVEKRVKEGRLPLYTLYEAIMEGAVQRVRPKLMTVFSLLVALIPIMYTQGVGSEVMKRIAAPMLGGVISSAILTLFIIPVAYYVLKKGESKGVV